MKKDLEKQDLKGLNDLLKEQREHLRALNFSVSSQQEKDVRGLRKVRHEIAKILTEINARRLSGKKVLPIKAEVNKIDDKNTPKEALKPELSQAEK